MDLRRGYRLLADTVAKWSEDRAPRLAAALAYYAAFSFAPILLIAIGLAGVVFGEEQAREQILRQASSILGTQGAATLESLMGARGSAASSGAISTAIGFFTLLLTVNGVGPKVALAIVGSRPTPDLQLAIMAQDQAVLVSIPGIGKKLAERIIFELREKVTAAGVLVSGPSDVAGVASEGEIVAALQALGYSLAEARDASRAALLDVGVDSSLEERVKAALRSLLRD